MNEIWVTVVGNIASEVIRRRVGEDGSVVSFRVMSTERRLDRAGGGWQDGDQFAGRVSCWDRLGENVYLSLVKGDPVVVRGRLSVREYEVDGVRRSSTEIRALSVGPDLRRSKARVTRTGPATEGVEDRSTPVEGSPAGFGVTGDVVALQAGTSEPLEVDPWGRDPHPAERTTVPPEFESFVGRDPEDDEPMMGRTGSGRSADERATVAG